MEDQLSLESRRMIFEVITRFPGLHLRELARRTEIPVSNLKYHLDTLTKRELLIMVPEGDMKRYYVNDKKMGAEEKRLIGVLRNEMARAIVIHLLKNPNDEYSNMLACLAIKPPKLSYYLSKLMKKGLVRRHREGRQTRYELIDPNTAADVLVTYRSTFMDQLVQDFADAWLGDEE